MRGTEVGSGPLLRHFKARLEAAEAELPAMEPMERLKEPPSCAAELDPFRNGRGMPFVVRASWAEELLARAGSVANAMEAILGNSVEVEPFRMDYSPDGDLNANHMRARTPGCSGSAGERGAEEQEGTRPVKRRREEGEKGPVCDGRTVPPQSVKKWMPFSSFLSEARALASESSRELLYLTWRSLPGPADIGHNAPECIHKLCSGILLPALDAPFLDAARVRERNIWLGCSVSSQIHFDALDNLHVCLQGSKLFHLYSPWDSLAVYPAPWDRESLNNKSSIPSIFTAHARSHPWFFLPRVKRFRASVSAGEALWIPAGWWHEVFTLDSFTVSANAWVEPSNVMLRPTLMMLHSHKILDSLSKDWP